MSADPDKFEAFVIGLVRDLRMRFIDGIIPTTTEYGVKVLLMDALLKAGCVLREAGQSQDKLLGVYDGKLRRQMAAKVGQRGESGHEKKQLSDVRIEWPRTCDICLKAASQHGSQEYLYAGRGSFKHGIGPDLDHLIHNRADLFFLAADLKCYDTLRGDRSTVARRAANVDEMIELLPPASTLPRESILDQTAQSRGQFRFHGTVVTGLTGVRRVILAMWMENGSRRPSGFERWGANEVEVLE